MKKRLVVGNWKMYIERAEEAHVFVLALRRKVRKLAGVEVWLAPPMPFLADVADVLESSPVHVGAQRVTPFEDAKHTGGVSAKMLKSAGALFAIIGHSERRAQGETDEQVQAALVRATKAGLTPILCVGERAREADGAHFTVIERQLTSALTDPAVAKKLIVAYEPVWAIGKDATEAMKPQELQQMVIFIRKVLAEILERKKALKVPVLYGGSVEPANAHTLIEEGGVSGFLVGHASTQLDSFVEIIEACRK